MGRCAAWQARMSEGKESPPSAWPTATTQYHTPAVFQPYYRYRLTRAVFLLWYLYVRLQSCNTVAWFYLFLHTALSYFYQHTSLYIFFASLNYASSLPTHNLYFDSVPSHWPTEISRDLLEFKKCTEFLVRSWVYFQKMITVNVVTCQDGAVNFSDKIQDFPTDSELWNFVLFTHT